MPHRRYSGQCGLSKVSGHCVGIPSMCPTHATTKCVLLLSKRESDWVVPSFPRMFSCIVESGFRRAHRRLLQSRSLAARPIEPDAVLSPSPRISTLRPCGGVFFAERNTNDTKGVTQDMGTIPCERTVLSAGGCLLLMGRLRCAKLSSSLQLSFQ